MVQALSHAAQHENEEWRNAHDDASRAAVSQRLGTLLDIYHVITAPHVNDSCDCARLIRGEPLQHHRAS
jgi:hypothetical protein